MMRIPRDVSEIEAMYHNDGCTCQPCLYLEGKEMKINVSDRVSFKDLSGIAFEFEGVELKAYTVGQMVCKMVEHMMRERPDLYSDYADCTRIVLEKMKRDKPDYFAAYCGAPVEQSHG